jgi:D-glycero-D-manno-heptose 1,7-bisphosphate phosphatase
MKNKALFLDRDGVINVDHGHVYKIEDFEFIDGIFDLCLRATKHDYLIFIVVIFLPAFTLLNDSINFA